MAIRANIEDLIANAVANATSGAVATAAVGAGATSAVGPRIPMSASGEPLIWVGSSGWSREPVGEDRELQPAPPLIKHRETPFSPAPESRWETGGLVEQREEYGVSEAMLQMYRWQGEEEFDRWGDLLVELGLEDEHDNRNLSVLDKWWRDSVELSANFAMVGKRVTPWQALRMVAGDEEAVRARTGRGESGGPQTYRQEHLSVTSPQDAKHLINNVLAAHLGRRPTAEEYATFAATLNAAEEANPTITTTSVDEDGNSTSRTSGGFGTGAATALLEDEARALPDHAEFQAASYYANALFDALDSPV